MRGKWRRAAGNHSGPPVDQFGLEPSQPQGKTPGRGGQDPQPLRAVTATASQAPSPGTAPATAWTRPPPQTLRESPADKLLLTPVEAAHALGIGRSKVYELLRSGALASVRIDTCRRIPVTALTRLVAQLADTSPEPPPPARPPADPHRHLWTSAGASTTDLSWAPRRAATCQRPGETADRHVGA